MHYVGCKRRLLPFIHDTILKNNIDGEIFCDLFAGTAVVGQYFKQQGLKIISNDFLYLSYVMQKVKIEINVMPDFKKLARHLHLKENAENHYAQSVIDYLNAIKGIEGFIYQHYSVGGAQDTEIARLYYCDDNAKKIDAIRDLIEAWMQLALINEYEFFILLYALLDEASNCSNTTGTMNSFLKMWTPRALRSLKLQLPSVMPSNISHEVYCQNSLQLLEQLPFVDILYLDPPYTGAQYATSYHVLETIARWDQPILHGITGRRDLSHSNLKSSFSIKREATQAFEIILKSNCCRHLLMSYSDDSLMSHESLLKLLQCYGEVNVSAQPLRRYNSMSQDDPRTNSKKHVVERLYYLKPQIIKSSIAANITNNLLPTTSSPSLTMCH